MAYKTFVFLLFVCSALNLPRAEKSIMNAFICLAKILNGYRALVNCPWNILTTCSAEHLICKKENWECSFYQHRQVNVSVFFNVYVSSLHLIEELEVIGADSCGCKIISFNCNLTTDRTLENISTAIAEFTEDTNTRKEDNSVYMILGAAFGGATFSMVVSILVFSLRKRSRQIEKAERLTENLETHTSMYESASGVSPFECNPISSRSSHGHVYNTVAETSPTSHIIPKVSHNTDPVVHQDNNDNTYLVLTGESDTSTIAAESHL